MCGIFGIVSDNKLNKNELDRIHSAGKLLEHRGPDDSGFWHKGTVALGHKRLSILDTTDSGVQPMHCCNKRYVIAYNGEIYNFLELKAELKKRGYLFNSNTDTEVIASAYDCWGIECLNKFNGMWAFSLWDKENETLILARDRFGVKPLYYLKKDNYYVFGSEVKALDFWLGNNASINKYVMSEIAAGHRGYHGTNQTHLDDVLSLPAGHIAVINKGRIKVNRWYNFSLVEVPESFDEQVEVFLELFIDACKIRLRSDVPVASCLSGGLDSSSIVSVLHNKLNNQHIERGTNDFHSAFSASFPNTFLDESEIAKSLSKDLGVSLNVLEISRPSRSSLEAALLSCDGPMPNLAFYPIYELYSYIRKHGIKVTLDGQGPDEMLGGYQPLSDALIAAFRSGNLLWGIDAFKTYRNQGESKFGSSKKNANKILLNTLKQEILRPAKDIIRPFFRKPSKAIDYSMKMPDGLDAFQQNLFGNFFQNVLPMLLNQYDRCSMANGVESRMPFMDYRLVEFAFSLPNSSRVGGGYTKRIQREAMNGILKDDIRKDKTKIGFHPPQIEWFSGELYSWLEEIISDSSFINSSLFDGNKLHNEFFNYNKISYNEKWQFTGKFWGAVHVTWWLNNR